jgi:hypothetical protein
VKDPETPKVSDDLPRKQRVAKLNDGLNALKGKVSARVSQKFADDVVDSASSFLN